MAPHGLGDDIKWSDMHTIAIPEKKKMGWGREQENILRDSSQMFLNLIKLVSI